ncbi:hypothetical protein [Pseudochrobactrum sp. MP213Fo]|uniref:hypothetical protein n=1 Tax=Pseudochrobactrum sp. MP213Fo TaxID=3022250 RepID=UPI003BA1D2AD
MSLHTLCYSFAMLWFLSGLLALQSALIIANQHTTTAYQTAAVLQERQTVQSGEPAGRTQNGTLTAPIRAILTPALYFSNKTLPFSGNGTFLVATIFALLALFAPAAFGLILRGNTEGVIKTALRARAPPAFSFI